MRKALLQLTSDSAVYGIGQVLGRAVQLLLVPVLTRVLAPAEFGVTELVQGYLQMVVLVLVLGMDGALARFFYQEPDREARVRMVSTSLGFRLIVVSAAAAAIAALAAPLALGLVGGVAYRKYVLLCAATLPVTMLAMFANDVLRVTFQPRKYLLLNFVQTVMVTGLSVLLVTRFGRGPAGVLYGRLLGDAIAAGLGLVLIRHYLVPRLSREVLGRMLGYGAPALPAAFAFAAIAGLDRYALQRSRSIEEVAVYAVALRFFSVMTFAASAFQLAYGPFAYARAQSPDAPRIYARVLAGYSAIAGFGALLVSAFAPEALALLVPHGYAGAALPALWLSFAAVALGAYTVASIGIGLALRTALLGWCAIGGAAAAIILHILVTPRFGPQGAAIATCVAYSAVAVVTYGVAQRVHPVPYRGGQALALLALALLLALVAQSWAGAGAPGVIGRLVLLALFAGVCVWRRVWTEEGATARAATGGMPPIS